MVTSNLRRVSATTWAVVAVAVLALVPESIPLGPIRAIARYLLVGYLPGLAIWNRLRSNSSSLVDVVLYPSLLSAVRPGMLDPAVYLPVYEDGDIRAYRVALAK